MHFVSTLKTEYGGRWSVLSDDLFIYFVVMELFHLYIYYLDEHGIIYLKDEV